MKAPYIFIIYGEAQRHVWLTPPSPLLNVAGQLIAEYTSGSPSGSGTSYLTSDHLGSTRVVMKPDGSVARYDYLPFGEEIPSTVGGRSSVAGYGGSDNTRQKFTQKERDSESGLDYFLARYYSSAQGRFTSPDESANVGLMAAGTNIKIVPKIGPLPYADIENPQSMNKYQYTLSNPLKFVDPDGHGYRRVEDTDKDGKKIVSYEWVNDVDVHDVPNSFQYIDTNGRAILLYGRDDDNYHSWGVMEPGGEITSGQQGNGPASYKEYGDMKEALKNAHYEGFWDPHFSHAGGFDFAKRDDNTLHVTVFTKDCCKGGVPAKSDPVESVTVHTDKYSPISHPFKHILRETLPQMVKGMPWGPIMSPLIRAPSK